ncbi:SDR family NAD(P)-dependent oxidoreductase [Microbacterium sp. LMI1-1-1.1]|uniref:SDR family NAD(P)-dependent oxidoreductase n=1 Tax=Microbacterium sp. LMI1-1-1.1 TaxID=3135223 RepID=UPI00346610AA
MNDMNGKVAIVTGGNSGIGEQTARLLIDRGARVFITARREQQGVAVAADLGATFIRHDVTQEQDWERVIEQVMTEAGKIDVLVNNAGVSGGAPIAEETLEQFERIIRTNLSSAFLGIRSVIPGMRGAGGGSIINVGSITGLTGVTGVSGYGSSKWGLRGLTKIAAAELGPDRIRVNIVNPGVIYTPMTSIHGAQPGEGSFPLSPLRRIGLAEEVGEAIAFLASPAAAYMTGEEITVDGGWMATEVSMTSHQD